jgi:hypothetical protein
LEPEPYLNLLLLLGDPNGNKRKRLLKSICEQVLVLFYTIVLYKFIFGQFELIELTNVKDLFDFFFSGRLLICFLLYVISFIIMRYSWGLIICFDFIFYRISQKIIKKIYGSALKDYFYMTLRRGTSTGNVKAQPKKKIELLLDKTLEVIHFFMDGVYKEVPYSSIKTGVINLSLVTQLVLVFYFLPGNLIHLPYVIILILKIVLAYFFITQLMLFCFEKFIKESGYKLLEKIEAVRRFRSVVDESKANSQLAADKPIVIKEQNLLSGRDRYAIILSKALSNYSDENALVISVNGDWGDGKTSLVNMALEPISKDPLNDQYVLFYNPWNFYDSENLIYSFLKELKTFMKRTLGKAFNNNIENEFTLYTKFVTLRGLEEEVNEPDNNLETLKNKVYSELKKLKYKIIVVIDDIDRLNNEETKEIFKLVKSVGDFPNLIYILPIDKHRIIKKLEIDEEYLKKIIQIEIDLPPVPKNEIINIFNNWLNQFLTSMKIQEIDKKQIETLYGCGFYHYLNNLRDVNRLINSLKFYLSNPDTQDLNTLDFMVITAIRLFDFELYRFIGSNKQIFLYNKEAAYWGAETRSYIAQYQKTLHEFLDNSRLGYKKSIDLLTELFPQLRDIANSYPADPNKLNSARINHNICAKQYFDQFMQYPFEKEPMSKLELESIIESSNDLSKLTDNLVMLCNNDQIGFFLDRVGDYLKSSDIQFDHINFVDAILSIGKYITPELSTAGNPIYSVFGMLVKTATIIIQRNTDLFTEELLNRFIQDKRHSINILIEWYFSIFYLFRINSSNSLDKKIIREYSEHNNPLLYNINLIQLQASILLRLKSSFDEIMDTAPDYILYWKALEDNNEDIDKAMKSFLEKNDANFMNFFNKLKRQRQEISSTEKVRKIIYYPLETVYRLVSIEYLEKRLNLLSKEQDKSITDTLLNEFKINLKIYNDSKRDQGDTVSKFSSI